MGGSDPRAAVAPSQCSTAAARTAAQHSAAHRAPGNAFSIGDAPTRALPPLAHHPCSTGLDLCSPAGALCCVWPSDGASFCGSNPSCLPSRHFPTQQPQQGPARQPAPRLGGRPWAQRRWRGAAASTACCARCRSRAGGAAQHSVQGVPWLAALSCAVQ